MQDACAHVAHKQSLSAESELGAARITSYVDRKLRARNSSYHLSGYTQQRREQSSALAIADHALTEL